METILITGANRGIGLELAKKFLGAGQAVIATCRDPENAGELAEPSAGHPTLSIEQLDVCDQTSVDALAAKLDGATIDVVINNAGIMGGGRQIISDLDYAAWTDTFEVNTIAPFRVAEAFLPHLKRSSRPRLVTISSQMGALSRESRGAYIYRSSTAAVNKVMQVMALDLRGDGIIVCPVHPGWVRTDMGGPTADISPEESAEGLFNLINRLTIDDTGKFFQWNGNEHSW